MPLMEAMIARENRKTGKGGSPVYLALGLGLPLLLIVGCVISNDSEPRETAAQMACTKQGRACDSDGFPIGLSEETKRELQKMDRERDK